MSQEMNALVSAPSASAPVENGAPPVFPLAVSVFSENKEGKEEETPKKGITPVEPVAPVKPKKAFVWTKVDVEDEDYDTDEDVYVPRVDPKPVEVVEYPYKWLMEENRNVADEESDETESTDGETKRSAEEMEDADEADETEAKRAKIEVKKPEKYFDLDNLNSFEYPYEWLLKWAEDENFCFISGVSGDIDAEYDTLSSQIMSKPVTMEELKSYRARQIKNGSIDSEHIPEPDVDWFLKEGHIKVTEITHRRLTFLCDSVYTGRCNLNNIRFRRRARAYDVLSPKERRMIDEEAARLANII